jgi:hypothetical protein
MSLIKIIQEAITQNQHQFFSNIGMELVEEESLGEYDIALIKGRMFNESDYQLAFQREGQDFTDVEQQLSKAIPDNISLRDLAQIPPIIKKWIQEYDTIIAGSYNSNKTQIYKKVFQRYGITVKEKSMMGYQYLILTLEE